MDAESRILVAKALKSKSVHKQDVYANTVRWFEVVKEVLDEIQNELCDDMDGCDSRVVVQYVEKGKHEADFQIAGDMMVFHMHTNVFLFDSSNPIWSSSYMSDKHNGFCGIINIYNFLTDSFRYNRENDSGYMIARIFINAEDHYIVQGKNDFAMKYSDFANSVLSKEALKGIIYDALRYCLDFDLYVPPYELVKEVRVFEIKELSDHLKLRTGKRLGFQFSAESND